MKTVILLIELLFTAFCLQAQKHKDVMSEAYWKIWNPDVQASIDKNIEQYRKGDAVLEVPSGITVKIEQLSHSFIFGGNIFLFGQLETTQQNKQYENTFGALFNSATLPFYWKTLEPKQGKPRYTAGSSYIFRRPPVDPILEFCESNKIMAKGHAIIYGMRRWGHPDWMPADRKEMEFYFEKHIQELASRYKDRIRMWDVVNEPVDQANRGIMPDDYTYKSYKWAMKYFPESVIFNINDIDFKSGIPYTRRYVEIARNMKDRGIRIDNVGAQMHIFNPVEAQKIAEGDNILTPAKLTEVVDCLNEVGRPVHVSEVTVCAPDSTSKGSAIQAVIAENLYRFWFSCPNITGITWWNVVDGGGAPGEPSYSGLYDKGMNKKPVYETLDKLINREWKTSLIVTSDAQGVVCFRGFKGHYRATWTNENGEMEIQEFDIK
ncbi:endo-1,4-beta-xylanase [uncultured Parabacteroides sp.]|uniref:endo-1,4-beta-xylanase n=1 Tax=uncultured Parabacteroides sp. TaxID=512312 RepID=UPI00265DE9ED|nr:endo-1,4-beta-xylanase [uncultured Parabacteroides sp.]